MNLLKLFRIEHNFRHILADTAPIHAVLEFLFTVLCKIYFPSHWKLSQLLVIIKTMVSEEEGMNPVAMTIINPG